ncbi:MAG: hypothetical protein HW399_83, partial [Dehalococcoidia bacterium]|nr:hypothetical protein [Dehalococcoidia bacterium]
MLAFVGCYNKEFSVKLHKKLLLIVIAIFISLSPIIHPLSTQVSNAQAAINWTKYTGQLTLPGELRVADASVIKDGSTYMMWYTHGKNNNSAVSIASGLSSAIPGGLISNIAALNFVAFLNGVNTINLTQLDSLLANSATVIGFATSGDGINWTLQNTQALSGGNSGWTSVGNPSVIKDGSTYKMWHTRLELSLNQTQVNAALVKLGTAGQRNEGLLDLLNGVRTVIGYATSPDGSTWTVQNPLALTGGSGALNSVGSPSVIKDGLTYKMWYTRVSTTITSAYLGAINLATAGINELQDIIDGTQTVIGYATSSDGVTWNVQNNQVLTGLSGAWNSAGDPSVLKDSEGYKIWYTQSRSNLTKADLQNLVSEVADQTNTGWGIISAFVSGDFLALLTNLAALNINNIKARLSNTNTSIGYAKSGDGITWIGQNPLHLTGSSNAVWSSVAAPSAIMDGSSYKMWYSQGIDTFSVLDLLPIVAGTRFPIGLATFSAPTAADFSISHQTGSTLFNRAPGATATAETFRVNSLNGFTGQVNLSFAGSPGIVNSSTLSTNSVTLSSGGMQSFTLNLGAGATVPPGTYNGFIQAQSGSLVRTYNLTVVVGITGVATFSASPNVLSAGGSVTFSGFGFQSRAGQPVALTWDSGPRFGQTLVTPSPIVQTDGTWSTSVTIPSDLPGGIFSVKATSGSINTFTGITIIAAGLAFTLTSQPSFLPAISQGGNGQSTIIVNSTGGDVTVALSTQNLPTGVNASFANSSLTVSAGGSSSTTLTITPGTVPPGHYMIGIVGTSGSTVFSTPLDFDVTSSFNVSGVFFPDITLNPIFGKPGDQVTVSATNFPPGATVNQFRLAGLDMSLPGTPTDSSGNLTLVFNVPTTLGSGNYMVEVGTAATGTAPPSFIAKPFTVTGTGVTF